MTQRNLMNIARNLLTIKTLSEVSAENTVGISDGKEDGLEDLIMEDLDTVSACAARIGLALEEIHPGFRETLARAHEVSQARAKMMAQMEGGDA
jgi:hypothetical protein